MDQFNIIVFVHTVGLKLVIMFVILGIVHYICDHREIKL